MSCRNMLVTIINKSTSIKLWRGFVWRKFLASPPPKVYHHFGSVVGLVWSDDPEIYAGGSVATGRAVRTGRSWWPIPSSWGLGVMLRAPPCKIYLLRNFNQSLAMGIKRVWRVAKEFGSGTRNVRTMLRLGSIKELIPQIKQYNMHDMIVRCSGQGCQEVVEMQELEKVGRG